MAVATRWKAVGLLVGAPVLAELVSGSTPPLVWILPPAFLAFVAVYGVSAVLIREFAIRIGGGPGTVLLLGLAFGVLNEGIAARSLFDPSWPALGALATYGRWGGVNWVWAEWIVPFHAVWSISFPVFLTGVLWPATKGVRFLTNRGFLALLPIPPAVAIGLSQVLRAYTLTAGEWAGVAATIALAIVAGRRLGPHLSTWQPLGTWRPTPRLAVVVGVLFFLAGQNGTWLTPELAANPIVGSSLLALVYAAAGLFVTSFPMGPAGERLRFGFVIAGVGYYTALSPVSEFALGRVGLVPIDLVVLGFLILKYRQLDRLTRLGTEPPTSVRAPGPSDPERP